MKKYLITGVALLFIGLEASDNPFDLKTNLQSLDEDQSSLISELRKSADDDPLLDDLDVDETTEEETVQKVTEPETAPLKEETQMEAPKTPAPEVESVTKTVEENVSTEGTTLEAVMNDAEEQADAVKETKQELPKAEPSVQETPKPATTEVKPAEETPKEQAKDSEPLETIMTQKQKEAEENHKKALEEERIAVQKYEAERLRKKQEQQKANAVKAKEEVQPQTVPTVEKAPVAEKKAASTSILDEINPDEEKQKAQEEADRLYLEAIKEVDAE